MVNDITRAMIAPIKRMIPQKYKKLYWRVRHQGISGLHLALPRAKPAPALVRPKSIRQISEAKFASRHPIPNNRQSAVIVSFYAGKRYYFHAAKRLAENCDRLGLAHDIRKLTVDSKSDWADICRQKISFYREMLEHHKRPIIWVDVDSHILNYPAAMMESTADITCFLRNFKYLPQFDPAQFSRLIAPPFLRFDYNPRVLSFLDFACGLESSSTVKATDDYFLQEAIKTWGGDLRFMLLGPSDICTESTRADRPDAYFMNGNSGHVQSFKGGVAQHQIEALAIDRQKRVLMDGAADAANQGRTADALVFYNRILAIDPSDASTFTKIADIYRRQGDWKALDDLQANFRESPALQDAIRLSNFLAALDRSEMQAAKLMMDDEGDQNGKNYPLMKSRYFRFSLDARAHEMGISDGERVPLWWMENPYPGNFGDIINPYVVERLTGIPPKYTTSNERVLAIGSIIKFAKMGTKVWGSGCPDASQELSPVAQYCAVRGPITAELVRKSGGRTTGVFGDPAWLLPLIYKPEIPKKHRLGLILHQTHIGTPLSIDEDVKLIDINRVGYEEIEAFIDEMLECEAILTTSLHGIIVAHAYGVPVRHCVLTKAEKQIRGDGTKFEDYFRSVGSTRPKPLDLGELDRIQSSLADDCVDNAVTPIDLKALLDAAPFKVRDEIVERLNRSV